MAAKKEGNVRIRKALLELLELPEDVLLNLSKVTIIGGGHVAIENHRGILKYHPETVQVKINPGELEITGENLMIRNIYQDEIVVEGKITNLKLKR